MKFLNLLMFLVCITFFSKYRPVDIPFKLEYQQDSTLVRLKIRKEFIDKYLVKHTKALIALVKVPGKKSLIRVKNKNWPNEIEYTYSILKDSTGKILFIAQIPYCESGDWDIAYSHYFDSQGNTYAFYKEESIFGDIKGGVVRKILLNYYNRDFIKIKQINNLVDKDYKLVKSKKNTYDFRDFKYSIYKNVNDCLAGYNIKLSN